MYKVKVLAMVLGVVLFVSWHYYDREKAIQNVHTEYALKVKEDEVRAKEEKNKLLIEQEKERNKKDETIRNVNAQLNNALRMLSARKERPKDSGEHSLVGSSCTGRELFKEDGEFLAREAARADEVVAERDYYFRQYEQVRLMIKRTNSD